MHFDLTSNSIILILLLPHGRFYDRGGIFTLDVAAAVVSQQPTHHDIGRFL